MAPVDLPALLGRAGTERPDHLAVVEAGGRALTWAELDAEASRVAGGLVGAGVVAGTRVLLALGNRVELVAAYLAVLRAQAVAVPVDPAARDSELADVLADSGSRVAVVEGHLAARLAAAAPAGSLRLVVVGEDAEPADLRYDDLRYADVGGPAPLPALLDAERLAVLFYTSGTTGPPRGAMLSHRALAANVEQVAALDPPLIAPDDVVLGVLPMFHVYGLGAVLGAVLRQAATLVLVERFDAERTLDVVVERRCTVLPLVPGALQAWLDRPRLRERLAGVRWVLSGSAPLDRATGAAFTAATGVPVHQGYGLTEASPVVTSTLVPTPDGSLPDPGTLGLPLPGTGLRLVDALGEPVVAGDPGEIELHGPHLFSGYWPDGVDGPDGPNGAGWWPTGDLGLLGGDGSLTLVDQVQERLIVSGFPVYPQEVEDVLRRVPGVAEVAVIGVPHAGTGQAVVAYVVAREAGDGEGLAGEGLAGEGLAGEGLAGTLRSAAAAGLAEFKRPTRIELVQRLPLTVTGRVQKGRLRHLERRRVQGLLP